MMSPDVAGTAGEVKKIFLTPFLHTFLHRFENLEYPSRALSDVQACTLCPLGQSVAPGVLAGSMGRKRVYVETM